MKDRLTSDNTVRSGSSPPVRDGLTDYGRPGKGPMRCQPCPRPVTCGVSQLRVMLSVAVTREKVNFDDIEVEGAQQHPLGQQLTRELVKLLITDI